MRGLLVAGDGGRCKEEAALDVTMDGGESADRGCGGWWWCKRVEGGS